MPVPYELSEVGAYPHDHLGEPRGERGIPQSFGPDDHGEFTDAVPGILGAQDVHGVGDHGTDRRIWTLGGRRVNRLYDATYVLFGDGDDHVVLAGEVAVDRAGRQAGLGEQVLHGRGVEAIAQEAAPGGGQDLIPAGVTVLLADLGHAIIIKENERSS